jgi:uncharacterized protein YycO
METTTSIDRSPEPEEKYSMRAFLQSLLVLGICLGAAFAVTIWPYQHYVDFTEQSFFAGGKLNDVALKEALIPPGERSDPRFKPWAILVSSGLIAICLAFTGLAWSFLKHWRAFATAFAASLIANATLATVGLMNIGLNWAPWLMVLTVPIGLGWMVFAFFQGITGSPIVSTLFRLIVAMGVTAVVTLLFPVIVLLGALLLKLKRGEKITRTIAEAPDIYEFLIMNVNPVFFAILPQLLSVQSRGRKEVKQWKGKVPRWRSDLNIDALKVGDVILTGVNEWGVAAPIQASNILSSSEREKDRYWCHTAIYVGDGKIIEAITEPHHDKGDVGVVESTMEDLFKKGNRIRVLRHRYLDETSLQEVVNYCKSKATGGCEYDYWGVSFYALTALMPPMLSGWLGSSFAERIFNVKDAYFCSELIAEAFQAKGHHIFDRVPWRVKPLDFVFSPLFREIPPAQTGYKHTSV